MLLVEMQYVESGFEPVWGLIPAGPLLILCVWFYFIAYRKCFSVYHISLPKKKDILLNHYDI